LIKALFFFKKNIFFRRKLAKNCDHNVDPRSASTTSSASSTLRRTGCSRPLPETRCRPSSAPKSTSTAPPTRRRRSATPRRRRRPSRTSEGRGCRCRFCYVFFPQIFIVELRENFTISYRLILFTKLLGFRVA
jgi:hypothetical protein